MAFLLINPADTARKLFVLGDPLRVNGGSAGGGVAAPTGLTASGNRDDTFDASWGAVDGATGYEYQLQPEGGAAGAWVDVGNVTSIADVPV